MIELRFVLRVRGCRAPLGPLEEVSTMKESKENKLVRIEENYIFYTCLTLVLAIAAFGIVIDVMAGR